MLARAGDLGQGEVTAAVSVVVVGPHFALHVVVRQHRVVEDDSAFGRVALSLIFVIIDAVDVYNSFIVLSRVALDLDYS